MKMDRTSLLLLAGGLLTGIGGAIGLQVYAQQTSGTAPMVQVQRQAAPVITPAATATEHDTDNIQDPGGKEQADAPEQAKGDTDNIQDPGGVEVSDVKSTVAEKQDSKDAVGQNQDDKGEKEDGTNDKGGADGETAGD